MGQLQLKPETLAEMVGLIEDGTISGKIGKQVLPDLLQVCRLFLCTRHHSKACYAMRCAHVVIGRHSRCR